MLLLLTLLLNITEAGAAQEQTIDTICQEGFEAQQPEKRKELLLKCAEKSANPNIKSLAYINLGTLAYLQQNITEAARFYDLSEQEGKSISSDPFFHAYRSSVNSHLGRHDQAVADAQKVLDYIAQNPNTPPAMQTQLFEQIIVPLHVTGTTLLENQAIKQFLALPVTDWIDALNRASVLIETKRYQQAGPLVEQAYQAKPNHPAILNAKCYLNALNDRAAQGVPYCEQALQIAPNTAPILHSYAFALAKNGQCQQSRQALSQAQRIEPSVATYQEKIPCEQAAK